MDKLKEVNTLPLLDFMAIPFGLGLGLVYTYIVAVRKDYIFHPWFESVQTFLNVPFKFAP